MSVTSTNFLSAHLNELLIKLSQHIYLSGCALLIAILIGVPLGICVYRVPYLRKGVLAFINTLQTIPSIALLAMLIPLLGIGAAPTIVALTLYALLPITKNTFVGLEQLPADALEAATALGFTTWQKLIYVELPLAVPVTLAGIRMATSITIGITTIAAFIGAGGLGDFITQGLSLDNNKLILLGAIPAALLALAVDYLLGQCELRLNRYQLPNPHQRFSNLGMISIASIVILLFIAGVYAQIKPERDSIVVGSKNFTEQYILGHMISDLIKAHSKLNVIEKLDLGNTTILQNAMLKGSIDLYPEYTGTAYMNVLHQNKILNAATTYNFVKDHYQKQFHFNWLKPLGFNNSQTLAVNKAFAAQHNLHNLSELARISNRLILAVPPEFIKRTDGLPGLMKTYHMQFKRIKQMEPDLMYRAIANHDADVIEVFTTDGRIAAYNLTALKDNKQFYPPYDAAIVIREQTLKRYPQLKKILNLLAQQISQSEMQHMNYLVNVKQQDPAQVAKSFLQYKHLL